MDRGLERLLVKAGLGSPRERELWFGECRLKGSVVFVPEPERADSLRRCFLERLRGVLSDCQIQHGSFEPETKPTSTVYRGRLLEPVQKDML